MPIQQEVNGIFVEPETYSRGNFPFDDLIEKQPGWLLKSGIPLIFGATLFFIALSIYIKYPDKLAAPFLITTENPPVELEAMANGPIAEIFIGEGQKVKKNQELFYIDNPANLDDVRAFKALLSDLDSIENIPDYLKFSIPDSYEMGVLGRPYNEYIQTLKTFQYILKQRIVFQQIDALENRIGHIDELDENLKNQIQLFGRELSLAEKDFFRQKTLNQEGVISDLELETNEVGWLQKKQIWEGLNSNMVRNRLEKNQLQTQRLELMDGRAKTESEFIIRLKEISLLFRNEYAQWYKQFLISSPVDGIVTIMPGIYQNKVVKPGDLIAGILPDIGKGNRKVAKITAPATGIGKLEIGNRVMLQLDAYSHKEYGSLETVIGEISKLPSKGQEEMLQYKITCYLQDSLITSTGRSLSFRQRLTGTAQMVSKDKSIIGRVLERLLALGE
ncbi:MAG: HlyD family efflux transporter periplasmic adaptor subunit [Saprospiraceae bacterium]